MGINEGEDYSIHFPFNYLKPILQKQPPLLSTILSSDGHFKQYFPYLSVDYLIIVSLGHFSKQFEIPPSEYKYF